MTVSTMGPYWRTIGYGSIVGIVLSVAILNLYYSVFVPEYSLHTFIDAAKWGTAFALISSAFVMTGTVAFARNLNTRPGRVAFVAMSAISPLLGWILFGVVHGLLSTWLFFIGYPLVGAVAGAMAGITAALSTLFLRESTADRRSSSADDVRDLFEPRA